jgi:superfamily II DNA or RNA helicase
VIDRLEIALVGGEIAQVRIGALSPPDLSVDFCLPRPLLVQPEDLLATEVPVVDMTGWLAAGLLTPPIHVVPLLSGEPRREGKSYVREEQAELFEAGRMAEKCLHGLPKPCCSTCQRQAARQKEAESQASRGNPFDLILPLLQPPLGETFDSVVALPLPLYPFQVTGTKFLIEHERALLADDMGLGKSIQAIVALKFLFRLGRVSRVLLVAPKSLLTDWAEKLWNWAPELRVIKIHGSPPERSEWWRTPAHVFVATYETLREDIDLVAPGEGAAACPVPCVPSDGTLEPAGIQFDCVLLDEAQKIKNPDAQVSQAVRRVDARLRWGLSGTPLENRVDDLIAIFGYLKPGLLPRSHTAYYAAVPEQFKATIKPYFLRRRKSDVLPELPPKIRETKWLELLPRQREAYDRAEREGVIRLTAQGDAVTVQHVLALITALKQICNLDPVSGESRKLECLCEDLEIITELNDKALVFSQYPIKTLKPLVERLGRFGCRLYDGSLSESQRSAVLEEFRNQDVRALLMSLKAGGLGLTLTEAHYVYHFDLWWNPASSAQAEDRTHRIGQPEQVFVTELLTTDTIEQRIHDLVERKRGLFREFVDDLSDPDLEARLTEEDLFGLFNLQRRPHPVASATGGPRGPIPSIRDLSPRQFENLLSVLYGRMGYHVRTTPASRGSGVDVYAKRSGDAGPEELAIQCKHYPDGVVGVEHARALYGVIQAQPGITRGVLVTSGAFSRECQQFCAGKRIWLVDIHALTALLDKHKVALSEAAD